jgi:hypothetical protein
MRQRRIQLGPLCVVGLVQLLAVMRGLLAETDDDSARRVILDDSEDQVRGAQQRVDRLAVGALDRARQREERAEEDRVAIDY